MKSKFTKFIALLLVLCLFGCIFCGCDSSEYSEQQIRDFVKSQFAGSAEITDVSEQKVNDEGETYTEYTVKSDYGFDFTVFSTFYHGSLFGEGNASLSTDYYEKLEEFLANDIQALKEKYNIVYTNNADSYSDQKIIATNSEDDALQAVDYVFEYYDLVGEYLPDFSADTPIFGDGDNLSFSLDGYSTDTNYLLTLTINENMENLDSVYVRNCALISYAYPYKVSDPDMSKYADIPLKYIKDLYINGEKFESDKYSPCFVWDEKVGEYLTLTTYGLHLDYNGGVDDHMQREIVTNYLDGNYNINSTRRTTEYEIGDDSFYVSLPKDSPEKAVFKKNGKKLSIEFCDEPDFWSAEDKATYFYYMKLSDYADLLNMDYEVSQSEGTIEFFSK